MIARYRFLLATIVQEFKFLFTHPSALVVVAAIPIFYPLVVSWLYQANQVVERPTIVVDDCNSAESRQFVLELNATQELSVLERASSVDEGWNLLFQRDAEVLVYIPNNFSKRIKHGEQAHIKVWVNGSNMLTYGTAYPGVANVVGATNDKIAIKWMREKGVSRDVARARVSPIVRVERMAFNSTVSYGGFLVPGVLLLAMQQAVLIGLAYSVGFSRELAQKKIKSQTTRNTGTNGSFADEKRFSFTWIEGKFLAQSVFHLIGAAFIVWGVFRWFLWPMHRAIVVFALFVAFTIAVAPAAILIASLVKDRYASLQLLMFTTAPIFLMSGFSWPLQNMPWYVQSVAMLMPATPALNALRIVTMKSGELSSVVGWLQWLGVLFVVWLVAAVVVSRRSWRPIVRRIRARS